jgi:predicted ribonuclease YlaK
MLDFEPKTVRQRLAVDLFRDDYELMMTGCPGTGKTFLAMRLALEAVLERRTHDRVVIVRSAVPTRNIGYLKGGPGEKLEPYEAAYRHNASRLFGRDDAYEVLVAAKALVFTPTSFVRGTQMDSAVVVMDEVQNMTAHEADSVITRLGEGSRLVVCGDFRQSDLPSRGQDGSGFREFTEILSRMPTVRSVEFGVEDIVRSGLVRDYILAREDQGGRVAA